MNKSGQIPPACRTLTTCQWIAKLGRWEVRLDVEQRAPLSYFGSLMLGTHEEITANGYTDSFRGPYASLHAAATNAYRAGLGMARANGCDVAKLPFSCPFFAEDETAQQLQLIA